MSSFLRGAGDILREIFYALIGQPSRTGPTTLEAQTVAGKRQQLAQAKPVGFWTATRQVSLELFKVLIGQPSGGVKRKKT